MEWFVEDIWSDTDETKVLNVKLARDPGAEKHICPMPLDLIERLVRQYTNPDETVYSPFMGIGSEGYQALLQGRRFIGTELGGISYNSAVKFLQEAERQGPTTHLFATAAE